MHFEGFDLQLNVGGADISFPMKSVTVERSNSGVIEVNWPSKTLCVHVHVYNLKIMKFITQTKF